jgi:hypothetical protein
LWAVRLNGNPIGRARRTAGGWFALTNSGDVPVICERLSGLNRCGSLEVAARRLAADALMVWSEERSGDPLMLGVGIGDGVD